MNKPKNDDSGFRWGPFEIRGSKPWKLKIQQWGGSVYYPYDEHPSRVKVSHGPDRITGLHPIIMKGNYFEDFTHARRLEGLEWYYWDNCLVPQMMYRGPHNPRGQKIWCRLVPGSTAPQSIALSEGEISQHESRINDWVRRESQNQISSWEDLISVRSAQSRGRTVLVCLSHQQTISHWYGEDLAILRNRIQAVAKRQGLTVEYREKRARSQREGEQSLTHQLQTHHYRCVICTHSAAAIEALAAGTPVVALGAQAAGELATTWSEFEQGHVNEPRESEIRLQIRRLWSLTWHKQELLEGDWSLSFPTGSIQPYKEWQLYA